MNRGATPYALRGTSLVLPNGTLNNPSIRLGGERTGLYRSSGGAMSLGVKKVRSAEFSGDGVAIFSDAASITNPGDGNVTPLSLLRNNGMTADNQETRLDIYDVGVPVARQSVFRESVGAYGFKWYGRSGGALHATPAMALSSNKDLAVGRDLGVTRNLLVSGTTHLIGNVTLDGTIIGSATLSSLAVVNNATFGGTVTVQPTTGPANIYVRPAQTGQHSQFTLYTNNNAQLLVLGLQATTSGYLGDQVGDGNIYTNAGRLLLGVYGQARVVMDSTQTRFFGDGLDLAGLTTTGGLQGRFRLGVPGIVPATQLHIQTRFATDGITLGNSESYPHAVTLTSNAQGAGSAPSHLYLFQCPGAGYLGVNNDGGLYTSGSSAGRLILGAYDQPRIVFDGAQTRFHDRHGNDRAAMFADGAATGRWRLGESYITPATKLHIETNWNGDGITLGNNGGHAQAISFCNNVGGTSYSSSILYLFYTQSGGGWQGGANESGLYTSGDAAGALLLGGQDTIRLKLNRDSIRFSQGGQDFAQMINGGYWGFRTGSPQRTLHVVPAYAGDGILIAGGGNQDPALILCNSQSLSSANAHGYFSLANANGQFIGGSLGSDVVLFSGGTAPGRLLLGSASQTRMIFDQGGNISVHSAHYGVRFGIKMNVSNSAGGTRLYHADTDGVWWAHHIDNSSQLNITSHTGHGIMIQPNGLLFPTSNQSADLGTGSNNWRYCYFTAIGTQLGGAGPSYQIHLGGDSAAKPTSSTWQVVSDARSKDQRSIRTFRDGLAVVQRLRPIRYRYNGDFITPKGEEGIGFVAEDLVEIVPEMVQRAPVRRRPQDAEAVEMLTVNFHPLFLLLVNAVQELASRVEQLEGSAA